MNTDMRYVVLIVGTALLLSTTGIIWLAATSDRPVPDVLVAIGSGALTGLLGLLVPSPSRDR